MKIAVTGSTGRIGREITRQALAAGHEVVGIDRVEPETPDSRTSPSSAPTPTITKASSPRWQAATL